MDLILWRHAEAEDPSEDLDDLERELTTRGEKQAKRMAAWLNERLPRDARILVSPSRRTRQTANALERIYTVSPAVAPGASGAELIQATGWPDAGTVLVVGHQPILGQLAAWLMTGSVLDWSVKKGGVWWLRGRRRDGVLQVVLESVTNPER